MTQAATVLHTAKTHTTGARASGAVRSSDGQLDIQLSTPGAGCPGSNPEQLFAAVVCLSRRGMGIAARKLGIRLPGEPAFDAEVDLCCADDAYFLAARLNVSIPGLDRDVAASLV